MHPDDAAELRDMVLALDRAAARDEFIKLGGRRYRSIVKRSAAPDAGEPRLCCAGKIGEQPTGVESLAITVDGTCHDYSLQAG